MSAYCHYCGTQIDEDDIDYCGRCGPRGDGMIAALRERAEKAGAELARVRSMEFASQLAGDMEDFIALDPNDFCRFYHNQAKNHICRALADKAPK